MHKFLRNDLAAAALALGLVASLPVAAQTWFAGGGNTRAEASGFGQIVSPPIDQQTRFGETPIGAVTSATSAPVISGTGAIWAVAETTALPVIGGLHLTAYTLAQVANGDPQSGEASYTVADATGQFSDFFRLDVPGYAAGTVFTVTAGVRIDALASAHGAVSGNAGPSTFETTAYWSSLVSLTPSIGGYELVRLTDSLSCAENQVGSGCSGSGPGWRTMTFNMPNQSWAAQLQIVGRARTTSTVNLIGGGNALATGTSDLGNTIAWGGITGLVDPSGAAVSNFAAVSASSGFDYRNAYVAAVPEPSAPLLLLAGLAALGWVVRRRHA